MVISAGWKGKAKSGALELIRRLSTELWVSSASRDYLSMLDRCPNGRPLEARFLTVGMGMDREASGH